MSRTAERFLVILGASAILSSLLPWGACAQSKGRDTIDDLLKSIGLSKPAFTRAPDFNLKDAVGGIASISGNRGNLMLVNFWATWCGPCRDEMPSMEQLSRSFGGQGFTVLGINQRESAGQVLRFMKTHGLNFRAPLDTDGRVAIAYRVYGIPATYLIDGAGQALGMKAGPRDWAEREVVEVFRKLVFERRGSAVPASSIDFEPSAPLPKTLRARSSGLLLHAQQDSQSEILGKLERSDDLAALGKVSGASEYWYMVRTKNGVVGWVRETEVESTSGQK
jgi:DsbE subfamily thiol:disulfide oxidoreductase